MNPITKLKSTQVNSTKVTRRHWETAEEDLLVSLILRDIDYATIGKRLERTISAVAKRAIKLGYSKAALKRVNSELLSAPKKRKYRKSTSAKLPSVAPILQTKIRNYRIIVSALALTQAATLAMLTI
jgi:hypothetical protein